MAAILMALLAANLCVDRISDKNPHPLVVLQKPSPGAEYYDPSFGTFITRITAASETEGPNAVIIPMYGTMPAWNADESLLILWHREKGHELYQGDKPYAFLRSLPVFHATDIEQLLWDPIDPSVLYYPTNYNALPYLLKHVVSPTDVISVIHDFSQPPTNCPKGDWGKLLSFGNDPQWMGYGPRKIVGMKCGSLVFTYSIAEDKVLAQAPVAPTYTTAPIVGPSERISIFDRVVLDPTTLATLRSLTMANPYEHSSMGVRSDGVDTWNTVAFDGTPVGSLVSYRLDTGEPKVIIGPSLGWPYPLSATHLSAIAKGAPGWVAVSQVGPHTGQGVLDNEIVLGNVETGEVCRVAHARTFAGTMPGDPWGYWSEPHVNISPSGTRLLFGSDWMGSGTVDSYVVDLRKPLLRLNCSETCTIRSLSPADYTCTKAVCTQASP